MILNCRKNLFLATISLLTAICVFISCRKDKPFTLAELSDSYAFSIASSGFVLWSQVKSDGGSTVVHRGICFGTDPEPTLNDRKTDDGTGEGVFYSSLKRLNPGTTYYARLYATNIVGTAYGNTVKIKTLERISDIENNPYDIILVGSQIWMQQNLRVTGYLNGDAIPNCDPPADWSSLTTGAYSGYYERETGDSIYGYFYNWYTITDDRNICPSGWHVPTDAEWAVLESFLGGSKSAGGKLKESGSGRWDTFNIAATNISGFTALPAGSRFSNGYSGGRRFFTYFWTNTEANPDSAICRSLSLYNGYIQRSSLSKKYGFPIRCIKD
jgi:uncharacterized protein (TIGR02145 family)